jgi:hypothetical protein
VADFSAGQKSATKEGWLPCPPQAKKGLGEAAASLVQSDGTGRGEMKSREALQRFA